MSDPYHEHEDRLLLEEHAAHPERFHRTNTMKTRFINHIESIGDPALRRTCKEILDYPGFFTWPASLSHHHAYEGGLLAHTVEVCDLVKSISASHGLPYYADPMAMQAFEDKLITAALWHDVMKIAEYEVITDTPKEHIRALVRKSTDFSPVTWWIATDYGKRVHHIQGSAIEFSVVAHQNGVSRSTIREVNHCILAHHGRKEWGSPVEPQTLEALILHQADMLSSRYGKTKDAP